ncbi:MAG: cytochrome-c oxidase, cbb3-type subunit III [Alphaproteobacteria bacterium]|nr:cytochrome-c oxidase, cbb3-type subunit III [Alphaproteobacteria bacterium]MDP6814115.1 cytochrome-c oxidase, cbb3-type subunit III [Alphaproteobacteria bacterium]
MSQKPIDEITGTETTGHVWDGIRELNTPLPRWWAWTLYATIIWAIGYWIAMPAWPLLTDYTRGVLGHSQRAQLGDEIAEVKAGQSALAARTADASLADIRTDPELLEFALAGGRSAFAVNCSQCHGSGAAGGKGYPNLNDDDWLWGGKLAAIETSILYGIRSDHDESRANEMPAFGKDELLAPGQIDAVADYVMALAGNGSAAAKGKAVYDEHCVACHMEDGKGNRELGSPNLTDAIWLFGEGKAAVVEAVSNSRRGVMPAWIGRLDRVTIKQLAVYIHSLGGGE